MHFVFLSRVSIMFESHTTFVSDTFGHANDNVYVALLAGPGPRFLYFTVYEIV